MIKNVLSIDLDVLFNGHTYADYMNYDIDPVDSWKIIDYLEFTKKYNIDTKLDTRALSIVCDIIKDKGSKAIIRVIEEHDEILGVMNELNIKDCSMINIDAHHDITYGNDDNKPTLENWVAHGKSNKMINDYHWICRPLSDVRVDSTFKYYRDCIYDIDTKLLPEFDLIVVCVSKYFTPIKYWETLKNFLLKQI